MLKVKNLNAGYFGRPVLKDISFNIADGEIACVLGQNGCGKTTLLKSISKIIKATTGEVFIFEENILEKKRKDIAKLLTIMSGLETGYFSYSVFQTVMLARYAHSEKKFLTESFTVEDKEIVNAVLEKLKIYNLRERFLTELSSGQLQKVFLARAIAQETPVLLLDEPTSHLDLKAQIEICDELKVLASEKKVTILAVFHDINLALNFADRVMLIKDGLLIANSEIKNFNLEKLNNVYETDVVNFMKKSFQLWK